MKPEEISISVAPEAAWLGIKVAAAVFSSARISNKGAALEAAKKEFTERIKNLELAALINNPILSACRQIYELCNAESFVPPAEQLITMAKEKGQLPNINTVVDSYNLVSAETFLSIGAHDLDMIKGNLVIKVTTGSELYIPLGQSSPVKVNPGEYACTDDEKIVCRMDAKQCEQTKITKATKSFIIYLQGNKATEISYLTTALDKICRYIIGFCSGVLVKRIVPA